MYLKCDVLLLADAPDKIRNNSLKNYGLCPSYYLTAPALSYDPDMHIFFEKDTRDGISYIFNRYSKAKSRYLKSYDPKQESKHI